MFSWGRATDGQLGLGGIEDTIVTTPRWNKFLHDKSVLELGCGLKHTVILLDNGTMHSCGNNEKGQLAQDTTSTSPGLITALDTYHITHVACGHTHSVAIDDRGSMFAWGDNGFGQLGIGDEHTQPKFFPSRVRGLDQCVIIQVVCGSNHTVALSKDGRVYSWGENLHGQLGHSKDQSQVGVPKEIEDFRGLPIVSLAAGGAHNFVLSRSLYVFGWGRNNFRQLGLTHNEDIVIPTEVKSLSNEMVTFIACGESHTAVLTQKGEVLTFGCSSSGQLGHGSLLNSERPTKVAALLGRDICQVSCGRMHTLAVTRNTGEVYGFGMGSGGQLGGTTIANSSTPTLLLYKWNTPPPKPAVGGDSSTDSSKRPHLQLLDGAGKIEIESSVDPPSTTREEPMDIDEHDIMLSDQSVSTSVTNKSDWTEVIALRRIYAGGDQSFASVKIVRRTQSQATSPTPFLSCDLVDLRVMPVSQQSFGLTSDPGTDHPDGSETMHEMSVDSSLFSNASAINGSLLQEGDRVTEDHCCVDLKHFQTVFESLRQKKATNNKKKNVDEIVQKELLPSLPTKPLGVECLRVFYVLPLYLKDYDLVDTNVAFMKKFVGINAKMTKTLGGWFFAPDSIDYARSVVKMAHDIIHQQVVVGGARIKPPPRAMFDDDCIKFTSSETDIVRTTLQFLDMFHKWNIQYNEPIRYSDFHVKMILDVVDLIKDYYFWKVIKSETSVVFCKYPCVLDAAAKSRLMMVESKIQMQHAVQQAQFSNIQSLLFAQTINDPSPFVYSLTIDRHNLIRDTVRQLVTSDDFNFKKPLHISFVGEEGEDAGGVQKEFFMLLLQEILNPDFGMFAEDDESHLIWFRDNHTFFNDASELDHYVMIGILCGLAIYNSVIIDVPFPLALYKKLLGWSPNVNDLSEMYPSVGQSLQELLKYDSDDFEEVFDLNFTITRSIFGDLVTYDLVKDGANKTVTVTNRAEYCSAYIDYMFNSSVREQFESFKHGFMKVCGGEVMGLMHPMELMTLMIGMQVVNWEEFRKHMEYKNGYSADHLVIKRFWEVFLELSTEAKKKFLVFYTGSNRIPIAGIKSMRMLIQRMDGGPGCEKLPVAHTCFNILDLPPYETKDKMKQKLLQAINFTSGFGIV